MPTLSINLPLMIGAGLSAVAALLHLCIIAKGASWYRFFGAGERYARAAEQGLWWPHIHTLGIACVLGVWAAYALSGAGFIAPLPALRWVLGLLTTAYLLRGAVGLALALRPPYLTRSFWLWSSLICLGFGITHALGLWQVWER
jgi:hypothetical protein